jgi:uncharacterized protein
VLVDANLLLYAVDSRSPWHGPAAAWLERSLNGHQRVGLPWQSIGAFLRIVTHPRVVARPLPAVEAWALVAAWLEAGPTWVPTAGGRTAAILGDLLTTTHVTGNLVPDAQLAALAIEHGLVVQTADTDFARFPGVRWENPLM